MALAVILGAFGAHALKSRLSPEMMEVYKLGVQYHAIHALGLILLGVLAERPEAETLVRWSGRCLMAGIVLFSGSLYLLALTGVRTLGAITPIGGLSFIAAWLLLAFYLLRR